MTPSAVFTVWRDARCVYFVDCMLFTDIIYCMVKGNSCRNRKTGFVFELWLMPMIIQVNVLFFKYSISWRYFCFIWAQSKKQLTIRIKYTDKLILVKRTCADSLQHTRECNNMPFVTVNHVRKIYMFTHV